MTSKRHVCGALLLASFFAAITPTLAAPGDRHPARAQAVEWSVSKLFAPVFSFVRRIWEKAGSSVDPAGNPTPSTVAPPASGDSTTESSSGTPPGRP